MWTEVYTILVVQGGISPAYVLDEMQMYEVKPLLSAIADKNRDMYEATRLLAWVYCQSNSKKKLKPTDVLKFGWDDEVKTANTSISKADIKRLTEKIHNYAKSNHTTCP